jgi:hypothetical protein
MRLSRVNLTTGMIVAAFVVVITTIALHAPNQSRTASIPNRRFTHDTDYYRNLAEHHAWLEQQYLGRSYALYATPTGKRCIRTETPTPLSQYHARLKEKYEKAARQPWVPVEADPPPPRIDLPGEPT